MGISFRLNCPLSSVVVPTSGFELTKITVAPANGEWVCPSVTVPRMEECRTGCAVEVWKVKKKRIVTNSEQWKEDDE